MEIQQALGVPTLGYWWLHSFGEMIQLGKVVHSSFIEGRVSHSSLCSRI